jgi:hypothetical protein
MLHQLLVVLRLLIVIGLPFIIIIIIVGSTCRTDAKRSQLSRNQQGIGVINWRVDGHVRELKKWLIPLTVNDLLVALDDLNALLHHLCELIYAMTHGKYTPEHLQDGGIGARGGGGTTTQVVWEGATTGEEVAVREVLGSLGTME